MTKTNKRRFTLKRFLGFSLLGLALSISLSAQAALTDFSAEQQASYQTIAAALSVVNNAPHSADSISEQTYWIDATNGIDDPSRTGQIDQPWKSITWAMNNVPYDIQSANIVVRGGVYAPAVLYIGEERGGDASASSPFNLIAFPDENVMLDGANVAENGALISIAGAANVTISGFEMSNISGAGKSGIYINNSSLITLSGNEIRNSQWTTSAEDAAYPTLSDRFNGIAVVGDSYDITIENNSLHDLVTGYGEPILVLAHALATLRFPKGTQGHHIDAICRRPLWDLGLDYDHGTGHGVGHRLSVHEHPQRIGKPINVVDLTPGQVLSIEPGYYEAEQYGIRIENLFYIVLEQDGFMSFRNLTLIPIQTDMLIMDYLTVPEKTWLKSYNSEVARVLGPNLSERAQAWLLDQLD